MSRRESRASIGARQNDALYEFETFKKKFLLANKHITKLNSTLSVRIEELNAQLHALNVENLRLRTSEIQLLSELKREKEKSRKVMADAEAATLSLTKHLHHLRTVHDIPRTAPTPPTPPSPKARRRPPPPDLNADLASPQGMRIARPPNVPGILEDEEPPATSSEAEDGTKPPTPPKRRSKPKPRLSASNLPLPTNRVSTPPPQPPFASEPNTRNDNVVQVDLSVAVAAASTAFAKRKPVRRQSGLLTVNTHPVPRPPSPAFGGSPVRLQAGRAELREAGQIEVVDEDEDEEGGSTLERREPSTRRKGKGKDQVTLVPPLPPKDRKRRREEDDSHIVTVEAITTKLKQHGTNGRAALQPIDNTIHDQYDDLVSIGKQFLAVNQRDSLSPSPVASNPSELDPEGMGELAGRERRARKSVNYAEPKLNTKMRRPDSGVNIPEPRKKRSSAAIGIAMSKSHESSENPETESPPPEPPRTYAEQRSSYPPQSPGTSTAVESDGAVTLRRKSRPQAYHVDEEDEDESDGADVDEEYAPPGSKKGWGHINLEGRRKLVAKRGTGTGSESEGRRHSIAV